MSSASRRTALVGAILLVAALVLGGLALTKTVTGVDNGTDTLISVVRVGVVTTVCKALTDVAQEAAGVVYLVAVAAGLWWRRRRFDAAYVVALAGAAWITAEIIKMVIGRPRPPKSLWVIPPDSSASFPSGHTTTATVVLVLLVVAARYTRPRVRGLVTAVGVCFALGVGISRVYLGDHYPTDVIGAYLTVAATSLIVTALADHPRVRGLAVRVLRAPEAEPLPEPVYRPALRQVPGARAPRDFTHQARWPEARGGSPVQEEPWRPPDAESTGRAPW